jgi:hypothetical protein
MKVPVLTKKQFRSVCAEAARFKLWGVRQREVGLDLLMTRKDSGWEFVG